jgi:hypothetical protein
MQILMLRLIMVTLQHSVAHHSETNQPSDPDLYHFD